MGKKPLLWLSGLVLAGLTLPGCSGWNLCSCPSLGSWCSGGTCEKETASSRSSFTDESAPRATKGWNSRDKGRAELDADSRATRLTTPRRPLSNSAAPSTVLETSTEPNPPSLEKDTQGDVETTGRN